MWCLRQKNLMRAMVSVFEYTRDGDVPGVCVLQKDKNWYTNEKGKSVWSLTPHHWEPLWVTSLLEFSIGRDLGALKGSSFFYPDLREDLKKQKQNRLEGIELLRTQTSAMW